MVVRIWDHVGMPHLLSYENYNSYKYPRHMHALPKNT